MHLLDWHFSALNFQLVASWNKVDVLLFLKSITFFPNLFLYNCFYGYLCHQTCWRLLNTLCSMPQGHWDTMCIPKRQIKKKKKLVPELIHNFITFSTLLLNLHIPTLSTLSRVGSEPSELLLTYSLLFLPGIDSKGCWRRSSETLLHVDKTLSHSCHRIVGTTWWHSPI